MITIAAHLQNSPYVSVIMPVYNGEAYLCAAIDSILNQSFSDFELIIVDDASTDSTAAVLATYTDPRIVHLRNQENQGQGHARNRALDIARGELIALQDADDISLPERLQKQVSFLRRHPEIGLVGTAYQSTNAANEVGKAYFFPTTNTELRWCLLFGTPLLPPSTMFRRRLITADKLRYKAAPPYEDFEFLAQVMTRTCSANLAEVLYHYRSHGNSTIVRLRDAPLDEANEVSLRQMRPLLPGQVLQEHDIIVLRRLHHIKELTRCDMRHVGQMLKLFYAFEQLPTIDTKVVAGLRKRWIKRMLLSRHFQRIQFIFSTKLVWHVLKNEIRHAFSSRGRRAK